MSYLRTGRCSVRITVACLLREAYGSYGIGEAILRSLSKLTPLFKRRCLYIILIEE